MAAGAGAAWGALLAGLASVAALPAAIYVTRYSDSYELLHAGFAIPIAGALGLLAVSFARRASRGDVLGIRRTPRSGLARAGRLLGIVGICLALSGLVALGVYGLLEYVGSRE
jgi:hypothetical protein